VRRFHRDDPLPLPPRPAEELPLWGWPQREAEEATQNVLPLVPSLESRWLAWKQSDEGERALETIKVKALALAKSGARRIGVKYLVETTRASLKVSINNSFTAHIARELSREPVLAPLIERRIRKAV
jgi:hypothetical protein